MFVLLLPSILCFISFAHTTKVEEYKLQYFDGFNCTDEDGNVHDMAGPTWREGMFVCSCSHACSVSWMDCNDKGPDHIRWRQVAKECELQGCLLKSEKFVEFGDTFINENGLTCTCKKGPHPWCQDDCPSRHVNCAWEACEYFESGVTDNYKLVKKGETVTTVAGDECKCGERIPDSVRKTFLPLDNGDFTHMPFWCVSGETGSGSD